MSPARTLEKNKCDVCEIRAYDTHFVGHIALPTGVIGRVNEAWWVGRLFLRMGCVGSIPSTIIFCLCEKGSKALDLSMVLDEGKASEITVTKSPRINEIGKTCTLGGGGYIANQLAL